MAKLLIRNVGQLKRADLRFDDLTVLVGSQAAGKSVALQFLKLLVDAGHVQNELGRYGFDWSERLPDFFDIYFGEGMRSIWREKESLIEWDGVAVDMGKLIHRRKSFKAESLFYIPAQRVLVLRDGWPRPFTDYTPGDPFVVREFSEKLRILVEQEFTGSERLFPQERRLKAVFQDLLQRNLFADFQLKIDKFRSQKRLVLGAEGAGESLPYMVWSAGQREFVPLLLGFYWLIPPTKVSRRGAIKWVVIEELEMGLHPRAISVVLLLALELIARDYRVCLSTHSPQVLDAVWALRHLKKLRAGPEALLEVFGVPHSNSMLALAKSIMSKTVRVYYFDRASQETSDISGLDPSAEDSGESGWGGLAEFSGRANDAVARAVANSKH
jgi:AAA15 family ATPase/GTPase